MPMSHKGANTYTYMSAHYAWQAIIIDNKSFCLLYKSRGAGQYSTYGVQCSRSHHVTSEWMTSLLWIARVDVFDTHTCCTIGNHVRTHTYRGRHGEKEGERHAEELVRWTDGQTCPQLLLLLLLSDGEALLLLIEAVCLTLWLVAFIVVSMTTGRRTDWCLVDARSVDDVRRRRHLRRRRRGSGHTACGLRTASDVLPSLVFVVFVERPGWRRRHSIVIVKWRVWEEVCLRVCTKCAGHKR